MSSPSGVGRRFLPGIACTRFLLVWSTYALLSVNPLIVWIENWPLVNYVIKCNWGSEGIWCIFFVGCGPYELLLSAEDTCVKIHLFNAVRKEIFIKAGDGVPFVCLSWSYPRCPLYCLCFYF